MVVLAVGCSHSGIHIWRYPFSYLELGAKNNKHFYFIENFGKHLNRKACQLSREDKNSWVKVGLKWKAKCDDCRDNAANGHSVQLDNECRSCHTCCPLLDRPKKVQLDHLCHHSQTHRACCLLQTMGAEFQSNKWQYSASVIKYFVDLCHQILCVDLLSWAC